ncbi:MAG: hypothetical protein HY231_15450 [Acidobacteria bacterium]|nr:hypothetical protein [Acidobacteriota bacterium]
MHEQNPVAVASSPAASSVNQSDSRALADSLALLAMPLAEFSIDEITPAKWRDFLSRWYLEEVITRSTVEQPAKALPEARTLIAALRKFFRWLDTSSAASPGLENAALAKQRIVVLQSLEQTLPGAIAITQMLGQALASQRGAFTFAEFLTSFEEGGHSAYDIGNQAGAVNALEGYFKVLRVDGAQVEAEELISEERVWPIIFPEAVAPLLDAPYIINLELLRQQDRWHIINCGFAYPPDTEM